MIKNKFSRKTIKGHHLAVLGSLLAFSLMVIDLVLFSIFTGEHTRLQQDKCAEDLIKLSVFWVETTIYCYQSNGCYFFRPNPIGYTVLLFFSLVFGLGVGIREKELEEKESLKIPKLSNMFVVAVTIFIFYIVIYTLYIEKTAFARILNRNHGIGLGFSIVYPVLSGVVSYKIGKRTREKRRLVILLIILITTYLVWLVLNLVLVRVSCTT
jgi:MFS family permease